jgi:hypothetical protein
VASTIEDLAERVCTARERPTPAEPQPDSFHRWVNRRWPSREKRETQAR